MVTHSPSIFPTSKPYGSPSTYYPPSPKADKLKSTNKRSSERVSPSGPPEKKLCGVNTSPSPFQELIDYPIDRVGEKKFPDFEELFDITNPELSSCQVEASNQTPVNKHTSISIYTKNEWKEKLPGFSGTLGSIFNFLENSFLSLPSAQVEKLSTSFISHFLETRCMRKDATGELLCSQLLQENFFPDSLNSLEKNKLRPFFLAQFTREINPDVLKLSLDLNELLCFNQKTINAYLSSSIDFFSFSHKNIRNLLSALFKESAKINPHINWPEESYFKLQSSKFVDMPLRTKLYSQILESYVKYLNENSKLVLSSKKNSYKAKAIEFLSLIEGDYAPSEEPTWEAIENGLKNRMFSDRSITFKNLFLLSCGFSPWFKKNMDKLKIELSP